MEKSSLHKLGDYIREVDVRNRDLEVKLSQGISNEKHFQQPKQVAENPYNDKIVRTGQFAFNRATTRNGNKISIAYREGKDCTVSASYCVFYVTDEKSLLSKYLMMWFRRPEFDRYAIYHSHGSAHEYFTFENMCDVELPIPSIEQQQKIVSEYDAVTRRISLNEQIIAKLEETAQALYRKMFVDGINKENLPEGWRMGRLTDIAEYLNGVACQTYPAKVHSIPVLKIRELSQGYCDDNSDRASCIPEKFVINGGEIIFSWSATLFIDIWCGETCALNQHLFKVTPLNYPRWFVFLSTQRHIQTWKNLISAKATSMGHIKREDLEIASVFLPPSKLLIEQDKMFSCLFDYHFRLRQENLKLIELQSLLLAKMGQK